MTSVSGLVSSSALLGAIYLPRCWVEVMGGGGSRQQVLSSSLVISLGSEERVWSCQPVSFNMPHIPAQGEKRANSRSVLE